MKNGSKTPPVRFLPECNAILTSVESPGDIHGIGSIALNEAVMQKS